MSAPVLTILAGPNGCGKSTLTSAVREQFQQAPVLDPDAIARSIRSTLPKSSSEIEAGKQLLRRAAELIGAKQSFTVETTLSGKTYHRLALRAKDVGFQIALIFIGTESIAINIERIKARVLKGGHDVPEADQRRRYPRSFSNAATFLSIADWIVLLDNSKPQGYEVVAAGHRDAIHWNDPLPQWAEALRLLRNSS